MVSPDILHRISFAFISPLTNFVMACLFQMFSGVVCLWISVQSKSPFKSAPCVAWISINSHHSLTPFFKFFCVSELSGDVKSTSLGGGVSCHSTLRSFKTFFKLSMISFFAITRSAFALNASPVFLTIWTCDWLFMCITFM